MKKFAIVIFIIFGNTLYSQKFSTVPEFPTETDIIEITFNISEMTRKDLSDYSGTIYTHTGLNTNLGSWLHVIGSWGNNNTQPSLTKVSDNVYKLTISNPRDYYSLNNTNEHITSLNFVLRSADGTKQTEDLFIPIYEAGLNIKIIEPQSLHIYPLSGEEIPIKITSNDADSLKLFLNNELISSTAGDTLTQTIVADGTGRQWIKFIAVGNNETYADSIYFIIRENLTIEELPENIHTGINYIDGSTVTLAIFAPHKKFIYAIGDFNNWEFDPAESTDWEFNPKYYFKITPDSSIFWLTLENLNVNQEYRFQYLVDGNLKIADPYSDKILEEEDDQISNETYPDLVSYPYDKTNFSVSVFQTSQTSFDWEANNYQRPNKNNLLIYELLVRDFVSSHNYKTLIDTLDYLQKLGINAVELMPVNEFEGNESWGYNPSFYFAPDKYYGTKNDLKNFIDECHKRDIAVIMDIVLNHMYGRSSFVRLYASGDYGPVTAENPWFNLTSPNPVYSWGFDLNHESIETQKLVDRVTNYWLSEFKFDGFRFDFTKGFTNKTGDGNGFDQSRIDILKRMSDKIWETDSNAYVILEHFAPDSEEKILTDYGMMVWGNLNYAYNEATMGYNENDKSNFSRISYKSRGFTKPNLVGYMESHDEERLMYKNIQYGNANGNYIIKDTTTALNRIKLAASFFILVPGPKMIWQFEELGYDYSIEYNGRVGNKPIKWDYFENIDRKSLFKTFSSLNYLKRNFNIFSTSNFTISANAFAKRILFDTDTMKVIIIGNFDVFDKSINPEFTNNGIWYDFFNNDSINVTNTLSTKNLKPGEYHIYSTKKLINIWQDTTPQDTTKIPENIELKQNYPNPVHKKTKITYSIPENISTDQVLVSLKVYDILGKEIASLVNYKQPSGIYEVNFNAENLSSGIYFYTLKVSDFYETKKMILIK